MCNILFAYCRKKRRKDPYFTGSVIKHLETKHKDFYNRFYAKGKRSKGEV